MKEIYVKELLAVCPYLENHGIVRVEMCYDGSGDDGELYEIVYYSRYENELECDISDVAISKSVERRLQDAAYSLAPEGYENNDGGKGTISLLVKERKVQHQHSQARIEYDDEEQTYTGTNDIFIG